MSRYRTIIALLAAMTLVHGASALMFVTTPLALAARGVGPAGVGLTAALFGVGFILGAIVAPRLIKELGHIRAFAFFAALAAALTLMLGGPSDAFGWGIIRLLSGVCVAGGFAVGESWIAQVGPADRRGDVLSVYAAVTRVGVIGAPFLIAGMNPGATGALMTAGALFALALTPIAATRQTPPAPPSEARMDPMKLAQLAPAAFAGAFVAGFVNGSVLQLAPIYAAAGQESGPGAAAAFNAAIVLGGLLAQWPAGRLSDFRDRRGVIGALAGFSAVMAVLLALTPLGAPGPITQMFALLWGAGALSFYAICVAHGADRVPQGQIARLVSGLMVVWALGAATGPLISGVLMASPLGPGALFWTAAFVQAALAFLMFRRRAAREPVDPKDKESFTPVLPSSGALAVFAGGAGAAAASQHPAPDGEVLEGEVTGDVGSQTAFGGDVSADDAFEGDVAADVAADIAAPSHPASSPMSADEDVGAGAAPTAVPGDSPEDDDPQTGDDEGGADVAAAPSAPGDDDAQGDDADTDDEDDDDRRPI